MTDAAWDNTDKHADHQKSGLRHSKIAVAQVGGPTAVINGSLYGFIKRIRQLEESAEIIGIHDGMSGLLENRMSAIKPEQPLEWLRAQPGSALGAGRKSLTAEDIETCVNGLRDRDIHALALAGGNGTMWACRQIELKARELGYELQVIGIPKTVDNDIMETDHTPGFPSAAKFVAHAVRDLGADLASMRSFEQVRVVETMGRNVGWLAAASGYFKQTVDDAPHLIYVPESRFDLEKMLADVACIQQRLGYCLIVVSEGLRDCHDRPISANGINNGKQNGQGLRALGGVGAYIAEEIGERLGVSCRYENLGMLQRCASLALSGQDQAEAEAVGCKAAELLLDGHTGEMVTIRRLQNTPYRWETGSAPFIKVAGMEREFDSACLGQGGLIAESYKTWLAPFIGDNQPYKQFSMD
ncbi:diphosphate--fructose-6-phosphate 1-phosphotransferase [Paenibacillus thalictri]|uniref:Pyrophosphate--fructose 6-phosphate 1-phosphotransferase n=1 Tax=Paenibacillus thalictri TaxID=2527873 RepID=A0A4Q9DJQ5_9BACL|nr:diphosphate--fructose-6-phosphate 1-phosphotransferase [Paenibacillus thalictri]TBL73271.1 diphosphate--fructose-6-phosphate 1-phosphotransferase [Paenibacillus thalictri]